MGEMVSMSHALPFIAHHGERKDDCKSKKREIGGAINGPRKCFYQSRMISRELVTLGVELLA